MANHTESLSEAYERRVIRRGPDECWEWTGSVIPAGYGMVKRSLAHRVAYELHTGPIPPGMVIDHICHTRTCTNPRHLRLATNKQNGENRAGLPRHSTRKYRGVAWVPKRKCWEVKVRHNKRDIWGGYFKSPEDANVAAIALRNKLFTHNIEEPVGLDRAEK